MIFAETAVTARNNEEILDYPIDIYMRLEWHMQKMRLAVMRLAYRKAGGQAPNRDHQQQALLEIIGDPERLRSVMEIEQ